jgi:hypothetical protein
MPLDGPLKLLSWIIPVILLAVIILPQMMRILREYERGVIFRLGKLLGAKGPGLIFLIPVVDRMVRMDLRVVTINVERQEVMTRDNVPVTVDAVVYFRVVDPQAAVVKVENFLKATSLIAQTTLRSVLGQAPLDDLLSQRETINQTLQDIIDKQTEPWGVKVTAVEVKDVVLPDTMKRAMAKQAEAERDDAPEDETDPPAVKAKQKLPLKMIIIAAAGLLVACPPLTAGYDVLASRQWLDVENGATESRLFTAQVQRLRVWSSPRECTRIARERRSREHQQEKKAWKDEARYPTHTGLHFETPGA